MDIAERASAMWEMLRHFSSSAPTQKGRLQAMAMELQSSGVAEPNYANFDLVLLGDFSPVLGYDPERGGTVVIDDTPEKIRLRAIELRILVDKKEPWTVCDCCNKLLLVNREDPEGTILPPRKLYWRNSKNQLVCHLCTVGSVLTDYIAKHERTPQIMTLDVDLLPYNFHDIGFQFYDNYIAEGGGMDANGSLYFSNELNAYGVKRFVFKQSSGANRVAVFVHGTELREDRIFPDTTIGQRLRIARRAAK
jgi:hypothetical protein